MFAGIGAVIGLFVGVAFVVLTRSAPPLSKAVEVPAVTKPEDASAEPAKPMPAFNLTVKGFERSLESLGYKFTARPLASGDIEHGGKVGTCQVAIHSRAGGVNRVTMICVMTTEAEGLFIGSVYQEIAASISQTVREAAQAKNWIQIALSAKAAAITTAKGMRPDDVPNTSITTDLTSFKVSFGSVEGSALFWIEFEAKP